MKYCPSQNHDIILMGDGFKEEACKAWKANAGTAREVASRFVRGYSFMLIDQIIEWLNKPLTQKSQWK